jgi:excisionase family DNA binding protein
MIHHMAEKTEKDYLTVLELAKRWNVTERSVRNWIVEGAFPDAYRVGLGKGSHYRVPLKDVIAFEEARRVRPS